MTELATGVGAVFGATTFMAQPAEADTYDDYLAAKAKKDKKKDKTRLEYGSKTVDVNSIDLDAAEKLGAKAADQKFGTSAARKKTIVAQHLRARRQRSIVLELLGLPVRIVDERVDVRDQGADATVVGELFGARAQRRVGWRGRGREL